MADTLLSVVLEKLASVVQQQVEQEVRLVVGVGKEVEYLTNTVLAVRDVLEDAERREVNDKAIQNWLEKLKDMAYEMDDVIDEWNTALLKLRIDSMYDSSKQQLPPVSSRSNIIINPCSPCMICLKKVASRRDIALKIKVIKQKLDVIDREKARFHFALGRRSEELPQRLITTSAIDISEVRGRDADRSTILDHLLGRGSSCEDIWVGLYIISIVGTGGMGKTTLAQLLYNHPEVEGHFDERVWVCVSDPFEPIRVCRAIVESLLKKPCHLHDLEAVQREIQTCILGKKFLLVLDDVWTENHQLWDQLKNTLSNKVVGSRILVTTRKQGVVTMTGTTYMHTLGQLSQESSRELFHQIAFWGKNMENREELQEIGEKIADKCKGLPLAIKALGNLMRSKTDVGEWEAVLNSEVWKLDVFGRDISPALLLSYYDLPPPIRRCFSFCAVFPKDTVFEMDRLVKLWMAHGYLNLVKSDHEEMEKVGREFFGHLAARSFFQDFEIDNNNGRNIIKCKMHDIVHDFAQLLTKNECSIMKVDDDHQKEDNMDLSIIRKIHHATLTVGCRTLKYLSCYKELNLQTLLVESVSLNTSIDDALPNMLGHWTCIRALDLRENEEIRRIPEEVGKLIHLRYLNLSGCRQLECLHEKLCDLCNLQTLNISGCKALKNLPRSMGKLIHLRHLENHGSYLLELPKGIGRLKSLRTLHRFIISSSTDRDDDECRIGDLGNLNNLLGSLEIENLDKIRDAAEAEEAKLKDKIHLHHLSLRFNWKQGTRRVADALEPQPNLKSLLIYRYGDRKWPNWVKTKSALTQLKKLCFKACVACPYLPPLGQLPVLEELEIHGAHGVETIGDEFLGSSTYPVFPKLKKLYFSEMSRWRLWEVEKRGEERSIMPCLRHLLVHSCENLEEVPDQVLQSTTLQILNIGESPILKQRYQKDNGEDWQKVSKIPRLQYE